VSRLRIVKLSHHKLRSVSLTVGPGECVCISGPSGAGKTLLLRAIADLDPHEGEVFLDGTESRRVDPSEWRRWLGLLPPDSQWWRERVGEHFDGVELGWLKRLGFDRKVLQRRIGRMSTGERQRLALLRLLQGTPKALLLDEPTANLDPKSVRRVEQLIAAYRVKRKAPVLWVSHDPRQIKRVCNRHYTIVEGVLAKAAKRSGAGMHRLRS